jgi:serine/threonine protein kinase
VELVPGIVVADRFRLVRPLGQGGMGAVWLEQHTGLDVPCAVKFIHEQAAHSPDVRARFEREAKAAAQLRSPHVVQILDHGVWQGFPYIAMELLEGEDLGERLHRCRVLPPREVLAIAGQVGRALSKAHGAGLVHRDLKPANIFLVRDEEREIAKVLDFGIAKVKETGLDGNTKTGAVLGTPYYMSPEQARGSKAIDHRSDLWALAVVVYQCMTGRLPFMGQALGDLFVKIIVEPLPVPSQTASVPPGFDAWWARAAERDPGQRFQTARELTDNLSLALGLTAPDGGELGSLMGSASTRAPQQSAPILPSVGGTIAIPPLTPTIPVADGPLTPFASAFTHPDAANPAAPPNGAPLQSVGVASAPRRPGGPRGIHLAMAGVAVTAALAGIGSFFALRSDPGSASAGSVSPSAIPLPLSSQQPPLPAPEPPPPTPAPNAVASASATVHASAPPVAPRSSPTSSAGRTPGPRPKTDFGF